MSLKWREGLNHNLQPEPEKPSETLASITTVPLPRADISVGLYPHNLSIVECD